MEALERSGKLIATVAILFIVFWSQCRGVEGQRNNTKMSYVCPPKFIRLGHSCYFFSDTEATWTNALFACQDRDSNLTVPARWEDRNLRNYLNRPEVAKASRWIGGIYDYNEKEWKWGGELHRMRYQSFSKMKKMSPEELMTKCIGMIPELHYRWSPRSCIETNRYICQTKLRKLPKAKVKEYRRRWLRMGKINEITAPSVSREENDPMMVNDVTASPVVSPKTIDSRFGQSDAGKRKTKTNSSRNTKASKHKANELKRRQRPTAQRRLRRPFPGYTWNRRDPEGSYQRNADLLRSGRTGLSPQQINAHLARLKHLRDKQIARRNRTHKNDDWLVNDVKPMLSQTRARTYIVESNNSALYPKAIVEEFDMFPTPPSVSIRQARG